MNIFEIEESLMELYTQIEENDGEITDDIAEQLEITQENFKDKIKSYTDVIKEINSSLESIKCEQNRLKSLENAKKRAKDNLSAIVARAVTMFGDSTKSGGKFIDFGTSKVNVRNSYVCDIAEDKLNVFNDALVYYINNGIKLHYNTIGNSPIEILKNYQEFSKSLNAKLNEQITGESSEITEEDVLTENDINNTQLSINLSIPLSTILSNTEDTDTIFNLLSLYNVKTKCVMSKAEAKDSILNNCKSNVASVRESQSITIK